MRVKRANRIEASEDPTNQVWQKILLHRLGQQVKVKGIRLRRWSNGKIAVPWGIMMRDCTSLCNKAGEHVATIGFNHVFGLWQIVVVKREEMNSSVRRKKLHLPRGMTSSILKRVS